MQYDPIKQRLGRLFSQRLWTRSLFYRLLDILLLRAWHIHRSLRDFGARSRGRQNIRLLDAGSGFGQYSYYLARKHPGWQITAIDIKEEEVEACREFFARRGKTNVEFRTEDLTAFEQPQTYDLILSVDVMEHIEDDESVLSGFYRSLKPGGMLLVSTPSDKGGSGIEHQDQESFIGEHVRDGYGRGEMEEKLRRAGFDRIDINYTYGKPGRLSWKLSMKYPLLMLGRSGLFLAILPLYYLVCMPLVLGLNVADLNITHKSGTGLLVRAWKHNKKEES